jgi:D-glucosaminate-6-phosphate ammonia-lyase
LLAEGRVRGVPHQGFGRSMKVGREEIVGLITALRRYAAGSDDVDAACWSGLLDRIAELIGEIPGVTLTKAFNPRKPIPLLTIDLNETQLGLTAYDAVNQLLTGDPPIAVAESRAELGSLAVIPMGLTPDEAEQVGRRMREVLTAD